MNSVRTLAMTLALMLAGAVPSFADLEEWKKTEFEIVGEHPPEIQSLGELRTVFADP